jgi:hypothetical protein
MLELVGRFHLQLTYGLAHQPPRRHDFTWVDIRLYWRTVRKVHPLYEADRFYWWSRRLLRLCSWLASLLISPPRLFSPLTRSLDGVFQ